MGLSVLGSSLALGRPDHISGGGRWWCWRAGYRTAGNIGSKGFWGERPAALNCPPRSHTLEGLAVIRRLGLDHDTVVSTGLCFQADLSG